MDKAKARRYILTGAIALITATGAYTGAVLKTETEKDEVSSTGEPIHIILQPLLPVLSEWDDYAHATFLDPILKQVHSHKLTLGFLFRYQSWVHLLCNTELCCMRTPQSVRKVHISTNSGKAGHHVNSQGG
ncbi:hypothetical protein BGX38DRAFT_1169351 [Terfezia claveryi]|nr:hypothetical protein BGX38DRAFT_1169351 [Terfezia claveryi]